MWYREGYRLRKRISVEASQAALKEQAAEINRAAARTTLAGA
jgi:hypothetical protein